jgi:diacylglycerol kinase (ATP)
MCSVSFIPLSINSINTTTRHIAIICNPESGKGKPLLLLPLVEKRIRELGFTFRSFNQQLPPTLDTFTDLIIMGGDGTINYTINHFKEIAIPIGFIACGTGNDFTTLLFGKQSIPELIEKAIFGEPKPVDAGMCNTRYFINGSGIGFDGWIVKRLLAKKLFSGKAAYYSTVISLLFFYRENRIHISFDNGIPQATSLFMFSGANAKTYGGGFNVAPLADIQDGLLECVLVKKVSLWQRLRYLPVIEKGKHLDRPLPFIQYCRATQIRIQSHTPLQAHLDGEHLVSTVFNISILPGHYQIRY